VFEIPMFSMLRESFNADKICLFELVFKNKDYHSKKLSKKFQMFEQKKKLIQQQKKQVDCLLNRFFVNF
jgi:predicted protein tyrosine phosphatase